MKPELKRRIRLMLVELSEAIIRDRQHFEGNPEVIQHLDALHTKVAEIWEALQ